MNMLTVTDVFALISAAWLLATITFIVIDVIVQLIWKFVMLPRYEFCDTKKYSENMKKERRARNDKK